MGGGDEAGNLVRLTASDHLFAHQLLARIYAKTEYANNLWGAVLILCRDALSGDRHLRGGKRLGSLAISGVRGLKIRKTLDLARERRIEINSGNSHPNSDKNIYNFRNVDGREFTGSRIDFMKSYDISSGSVFRIINDEDNKTKCGWFVPDESIGEDERILRSDQERYIFSNINGATYKGTRLAFKRHTNMDWWLVHAIVDSGGASPSGWMI